MAEESVAHKTARTSFWGALEKMSVMGVQFVVSMVLARLLTPADYGTIAMLSVFIAVSNQFVSCGFGNALIRKPDCKSVDYSTAFYFNVIVSLLLYALLFLIAPWVANFYDMDILCPVLRVCGLSLPVSALQLVQVAILNKNLKAEKSALIQLCSAIVSGGIGITMALNGFNIWSLVAQQLSWGCCTTLIVWLTTKWYPKLEFSRDSMKYLWCFGSKMLLTGIISSFYGNIYSVVIGKFYDRASLGVFNRGQKLAKIIPDVAESVFVKNSLPILSQLQNDNQRLIHVYRELMKVACFITFPAVCMVSILAEPFVRLVLTEKWMASVLFIQIFAMTSFLSPANSINLSLLQTFGRTDYTLKAEIIKKSTGLLAVFLLLPFGPTILAVGSSCMGILAFIVNLYYAKKVAGLNFFIQLKDLWPIFISSIIMSIVVIIIISIIPWDIAKLVVGVAVGVIVYYAITRYGLKLSVYSQMKKLRK